MLVVGLAIAVTAIWFVAPSAVVFPAVAASSTLNNSFPNLCPTTPVQIEGSMSGFEQGMTVSDATDLFEQQLSQHQVRWHYLEIATPPPSGDLVDGWASREIDRNNLRAEIMAIDHSLARWDLQLSPQHWRIWCFGYERRGRVHFSDGEIEKLEVYWEWGVYI